MACGDVIQRCAQTRDTRTVSTPNVTTVGRVRVPPPLPPPLLAPPVAPPGPLQARLDVLRGLRTQLLWALLSATPTRVDGPVS